MTEFLEAHFRAAKIIYSAGPAPGSRVGIWVRLIEHTGPQRRDEPTNCDSIGGRNGRRPSASIGGFMSVNILASISAAHSETGPVDPGPNPDEHG